MDKMLEEQIARMKQLNERLAQVHRGMTDAMTDAAVRHRQIGSGRPLDEVRDYRIVDSPKHDAAASPARPRARRSGKTKDLKTADLSRRRRRR